MPAEQAPASGAGTGAGLIDGTALAVRIRGEVATEVAALRARGVVPGLTVVLVGDDPASAVYVGAKEKASREAGMSGETIRLPADTSQDELLALVHRLNTERAVHGILVQMPLPRHIDPEVVIHAIRPDKDVDGFHPVNAGKVLIGEKDGFAPCTPAGVQRMLTEYAVETRGADCVIVGRSNIVGKPLAALLMQSGAGADATVTVCHSRTRDLAAHTRRADIIVAAAGVPGIIKPDMVKPGAAVLDVGVSHVDGKLTGDVAPGVEKVAGFVSPNPGGVGPMTRAQLLTNVVEAAERTLQ